MQFWVRIARWRAQGGVDTAAVAIEAAGVEAAIAQAARTLETFLEGRPGVAVLTCAARGAIWARRVNMPPPIAADAYARRGILASPHGDRIPESEPCPDTSSTFTTGPS